MKKKVIIADIASIKKGNVNFGHYGKVAKMYSKMLGEQYDVTIAGGPVYQSIFREEQLILLPYEVDVENLNKRKEVFLFKLRSIWNGIRLFQREKKAVVICQPYSFISWAVALLFASRKTRIYLIEYKNELNKKVNAFSYKFIKNKISGIICPNEAVGKAYQVPYLVVPDYIYDSEQSIRHIQDSKYDFGMVGIMSDGKDVDDVINNFRNTEYSVVIAGYFQNDNMYKKCMERKTDNITVINKYLSNEEYNSIFDSIKYVLLPYKENYKEASSGVIYDVLFHGKPVITKEFENFKFVSEYNIGVLYNHSLQELNFESLINCKVYEGLQKQIINYLKENQQHAARIRKFIDDRNKDEN